MLDPTLTSTVSSHALTACEKLADSSRKDATNMALWAFGGHRADKPHATARKHTRRRARRAQSHPYYGHGGGRAVDVALAGRCRAPGAGARRSPLRRELLVAGVDGTRCDLSSAQQHDRVDDVRVEERRVRHVGVPASASDDSTLAPRRHFSLNGRSTVDRKALHDSTLCWGLPAAWRL